MSSDQEDEYNEHYHENIMHAWRLKAKKEDLSTFDFDDFEEAATWAYSHVLQRSFPETANPNNDGHLTPTMSKVVERVRGVIETAAAEQSSMSDGTHSTDNSHSRLSLIQPNPTPPGRADRTETALSLDDHTLPPPVNDTQTPPLDHEASQPSNADWLRDMGDHNNPQVYKKVTSGRTEASNKKQKRIQSNLNQFVFKR